MVANEQTIKSEIMKLQVWLCNIPKQPEFKTDCFRYDCMGFIKWKNKRNQH
jgi:hypothetical protein|tara:strand:- start:260 stop:412 length:153 start_codon:yes stop_codon:yes gene_type:complete